LRWNVVGHVSAAIVNAMGGFFLGRHFGAFGVVLAWVIALTLCGGFVVSVGYHLTHGIPLSRLIPRSSILLVALCVFGVAITYLVLPQFVGPARGLGAPLLNYGLLSVAIISLLWVHPSRKQLFRLIMERAG